MTQTWWLSFCDAQRPTGQQFLGVAIVDVDDDDAAEAKAIIDARFPDHEPDAEWTAAATRKAHRLGCNPGGDVGSVRIDQAPNFGAMDGRLPRNRLLSKTQLAELGVL